VSPAKNEVNMSAFSRRKFLQSSAAATAASALTKAAAAGVHGKLNVLLIAVDDQNTRLGCYGDRFAKTPNLDALAARGTTFEKAYCQYPLCGPSRASLMTGLAPDTTRIYGNENRVRDTVPDVTTIGQLFRKNGYYSARVGKIYHADNPADIGQDGLDDPATWDYVFNPQGVDHPKEEPEVTNFTPLQTRHDKNGYARLGSTISFYESPSPDRTMTDSLGADETIRLLREKRNQPFFVAYGLYRPHVPWIVPKAYFDMFPLENIKAKPLGEEELHQAPAPAYTTHPPNFGMTELQCRQAIRAYYASSAFMDAQAGRVLSELRALGLEKNTVIVFWGDHGWSLGEHGQWEKQTVFESAAHVPLIFAGPGTTSGKVCTRTVEHLDIFPTLAALCGLKAVPPTLQGQSLTPLLKDSKSPWSKPAISQVTRPPAPDPKTIGYSIRDERYRYTSWQGATAGEELYDYDADPEEKKNIAADPSMAGVKTQLKQQLASVTASRGRKIQLGAMLPPTAKEDKGRPREEP
jgi:iduronate 2-sulfatase